MFSFALEDTPNQVKSVKISVPAQCRLMGFRHNPYVGTFHRVNYIPFSSEIFGQTIMNETRKNPLIGLIRHSPSTVRKCVGLKGVVKDSGFPKLQTSSRIHFTKRPSHNQATLNFVTSIRELSHSVYSCDSPATQSVHDNDMPSCVICLQAYLNGDELLTLKCGHCYHSECVSKWFFQDCLDSSNLSSTFKCPQCRKSHTDTTDSSTIGDEGIASLSLLRVGQNLIEEGGYDFLNDVGFSELSSENLSPNPHKLSVSSFLGSNYSDCGIPITKCK